MSTKIGQFEILSELAKSPTSIIYKANDLENGQTVALKSIQLSAFGEQATALEQALLKEAESIAVLNSQNIAGMFGAGEIEGQFCAAMEYVQGNSIATMLARKEGFSIWDLLDIGRQLCNGLDHAAAHHIVHHSLEPSKIMCGWDGTVKILSFGVSGVGNFVKHLNGGVSSILYYVSPEQIRGEATDIRSNLFSLGAIFYEMVTERKAFDREDVESLKQSILESTPVAPIQRNPKVNPALSDLIMRALATDPAQRYSSGREMLDDLEKCKESKPSAKKPDAAKTAAASKPVAPAVRPQATPPSTHRPATPAAATAAPTPATRPTPVATPASRLASPKTAAAAAGVAGGVSSSFSQAPDSVSNSQPAMEAAAKPSAYMSSAAAAEPEIETFEPQVAETAPRIAVDPLMAGGESGGSAATSFSDIAELPPLKEVYVAPKPAPPTDLEPVAPAVPMQNPLRAGRKADEKPKIQPREVAEKAIKEIKGVPPKLMFYSLAGAAALILAIGIGVTVYIHSQNKDDDAGTSRSTVPAMTQTPSQPAPPMEAAPTSVENQPVEIGEAPAPERAPVAASKTRPAKKKAAPASPVVIPGQLAVDSTPAGAQVQVDGQGDSTWVTPFALTGLQPGQHSITVSKAGYVTETRTVDVTSGNRATTSVHLTQMIATLIVKSDPPGANVFLDGHDVGTKTPAQVSVNKGQHVVLVRLEGYLDETMNADFVLGQTFNFSPTLRPLGNVDSIKTVGKMSKLFGGRGTQPGQATVSIRTQPKGAQVAVNQHMIDKPSPVDVALDPGNYVIDITLSGYAPVHKVITVDKKAKVVIDEVLTPQ